MKSPARHDTTHAASGGRIALRMSWLRRVGATRASLWGRGGWGACRAGRGDGQAKSTWPPTATPAPNLSDLALLEEHSVCCYTHHDTVKAVVDGHVSRASPTRRPPRVTGSTTGLPHSPTASLPTSWSGIWICRPNPKRSTPKT